MKRKTIFIIAAVISLALMAGPVFAEYGACGSGMRGACHGEKKAGIMRELNLTAEQDKLLKDTKAAHRAEMEKLVQALKAKKEELQSALAKPGVTKEQVGPIAAEIKALQSQMVDRRIDGILKIKEILTPEQFQKLQGMKEGRKDRGRKEHSGKRW